jgi:hypothetical protein
MSQKIFHFDQKSFSVILEQWLKKIKRLKRDIFCTGIKIRRESYLVYAHQNYMNLKLRWISISYNWGSLVIEFEKQEKKTFKFSKFYSVNYESENHYTWLLTLY